MYLFDRDHLPLACKVLFATGGTVIAWFTCCLFDNFLVTVLADRFSEMGEDVVVVAVVWLLFGVSRFSENKAKKQREKKFHTFFLLFFSYSNVSWNEKFTKLKKLTNK